MYIPLSVKLNNNFGEVKSVKPENKTVRTVNPGKKNFSSILEDKFREQRVEKELKGIILSKHAAARLRSRELALTAVETDKLQRAVDTASKKGCRESLCLIGNKAFVVNIKNRTIITAMRLDRMADNIITNIDSAILD